jgi:hypothetical protein
VRRILIGVGIGLLLAVAAFAALVGWTVRTINAQESAIRGSYNGLVSHSGPVWNQLTPGARAWLLRQPWSDLYKCSSGSVDLDTSSVDVDCDDLLVRTQYQFDCRNGLFVELLRFFRLMTCTASPRLVGVQVKKPHVGWVLVFSDGEPLTK